MNGGVDECDLSVTVTVQLAPFAFGATPLREGRPLSRKPRRQVKKLHFQVDPAAGRYQPGQVQDVLHILSISSPLRTCLIIGIAHLGASETQMRDRGRAIARKWTAWAGSWHSAGFLWV